MRSQSSDTINAEVESGLGHDKDWEWLRFGRDGFERRPDLVRKTKLGVERLEPDAELLALFDRAEQLYGSAGFNLAVANWRLRAGGLEFGEILE